MAQKKAHEVDAFIARPDASFSVVLIYGQDRGLVAERAHHLARNSGVDLSDAMSVVRMAADDAASDPASVSDEAHAISMFGGKRLVWITGSTQKQFVKAIQPVLDVAPEGSLVVIEAGELRKTAPLLKAVTACRTAMALPCYQDSAAALAKMIDEELSQAQLTMDQEARALLVASLGEDRLVSRGEVQKLMLYTAGQERISVEDVSNIVGDGAATSIDAIVGAASMGNVAVMETELARFLNRKEGVGSILALLQRHFFLLHELRCRMEANGQSASSVVATARPPLPFSRKAASERALALWSIEALSRALERINSVILESRANASLDEELAKTALLALALQARQRASRTRR